MGKRGATEVVRCGKAARTLKGGRSVAALTAALRAPLVEVFSEESAAGADATADMLCTAIPFAFSVSKEDRHAHQAGIIESVNKALLHAEKTRQSAVTAADAAIASHNAKCRNADADLAAAKARAAASKNAKEQKTIAAKEADDACNEAGKVVKEHVATIEEYCSTIKSTEDEKESYKALQSDTFNKLKEETFDKKRCSARHKQVSDVMKKLNKASIPTSLSVGLDATMKMQPAERGPFALKALEHGEKFFATYIGSLTTKIASLNASVDDVKKELVKSEAERLQAEQVKGTARELAMAGDNTWAEHETEVYEISETLKKAEPRSEELVGIRTEKQGILSDVQALQASFKAFVDGKPADEDDEQPEGEANNEE